MKPDFEKIVRDNTAWMLAYVRAGLSNKSLAEDIVQEIWMKAFRAYDSYVEDGRLRPWLMRITRNTLLSHLSSANRISVTSLDYDSDGNDPLYTYLSDSETPEEKYLRQELAAELLSLIEILPNEQRKVISLRFFDDLSVIEAARIMQIPPGTVKSKTHYAIEAIRKHMGIKPERTRGERKMECKDFYKYLFMYALGKISAENKEKVDAHISECRTCADVVSALEKLIPHMNFGLEDETMHFSVEFPEIDLSYTGIRYENPNFEAINRQLEIWKGDIPEDQTMIDGRFNQYTSLLGRFDNEGDEIKFVLIDGANGCKNVKITHIERYYRYMWHYDVYYGSNPTVRKTPSVTVSKEAPDLRYGYMANMLEAQAKSALYQAVPADAGNIRIKRGNGVLDCGTYKFAYVDRYVVSDERIVLEYSFLKNK